MAGSETLTYVDLAAIPGDGLRRELLDGELIVTSSPNLRHQSVSWRLTLAFGKHLEALGGGQMFAAPADVLLSDGNVVVPDLVFISDQQLEIVTQKNVQGVPSLLIEIVSDSRMDRVRKRDLYARFGVPEYWIVDPDVDRIEVCRHDGAGYGKPEIYEPGELLAYALLPGFALDLAVVFSR